MSGRSLIRYDGEGRWVLCKEDFMEKIVSGLIRESREWFIFISHFDLILYVNRIKTKNSNKRNLCVFNINQLLSNYNQSTFSHVSRRLAIRQRHS